MEWGEGRAANDFSIVLVDILLIYGVLSCRKRLTGICPKTFKMKNMTETISHIVEIQDTRYCYV